MRLLACSLVVLIGAAGFAKAQPNKKEDIAAPRLRLVFAKEAGVPIFAARAGGQSIGALHEVGPELYVLEESEARVRIKTWYEVEGWVNVADIHDVGARVGLVHLLSARIRASDADPRLYLQRGIAWRDAGESDIAMLDFTESLRLKEEQSDVYVQRGIAWYTKTRPEFDKALLDFDRALRIAPKSAWGYFHRARALQAKWVQKEKDDDGVTARLAAWRSAEPNATKNLDKVYQELKGSLSDFDQALRHEPAARALVAKHRIWVNGEIERIENRD